MSIISILRSIRTLGLNNSFSAVLYAFQRDRNNRADRRDRIRVIDKPLNPGSLQEAYPIQTGARFHFEHADLEIVFLDSEVVRLSWKPGIPPIPYAIADFTWPGASSELTETDEGWRFRSNAITINIGKGGNLTFIDTEGSILRDEEPPTRVGEAWTHRAGIPEQAGLYGLGERAAGLNLRGGSYRLWNQDPGGSYGSGDDPLHFGAPVYMCLHCEGSYLVFYENSFDGYISFNKHAEAHFESGMLRYYFIPGPPDKVLDRFTDLTGKPQLPPLWALGYHQSRWGYKTEAEIRELARNFAHYELPISAIHLDIDYMDGYRVFTVDRKRFPDLKRLTTELLEEHIHVVSIIDPGVKIDRNYPIYNSGIENDVFCKLPSGQPLRSIVWPGWVHVPDFTDSRTRQWWMDLYPRLLEKGIAGIWHDMNEPSALAAWGDKTLPLDTRHTLEGQIGDHRQGHNLYGLLMNKAGHEALQQHRPDKRPFLLTRSGWVGVQRYAWNWTGDVESSWAALEQTITIMLGVGLSGIPYTGSDIGGFSGDPGVELYLRWFQMAAFTPFFRTHSDHATPRREPWAFDDSTLQIVRSTLHLRYRLLPYLYTLAWESAQTGLPLMRPLFWLNPQEPSYWDIQDQFLLGNDVLVAPVTEPGVEQRIVTLPPGLWYSFWDDHPFDGPGEVTIDVSLEKIPVFIRAGAILPTQEGEELTLHLYLPVQGNFTGSLYNDEGEGYGPWRVDRFSLNAENRSYELLREVEGAFVRHSHVWLAVHGAPVKGCSVDSQDVHCEDGRFFVGDFQTVHLEIE
ncbi:MAG: glycoside hydrolase family 31 protein [Anaerolineales bacterium]|nr:glycoside hydrolase family 31 protein [Anaerolineales bacterium]